MYDGIIVKNQVKFYTRLCTEPSQYFSDSNLTTFMRENMSSLEKYTARIDSCVKISDHGYYTVDNYLKKELKIDTFDSSCSCNGLQFMVTSTCICFL